MFIKASLQQKLDLIYIFITNIYLKLTFIEANGSYYKNKTDDVKRILSIYTEIQELQKMVEKFLEIEEGLLDLSINIENEIRKNKSELEKYSEEIKEFPIFDNVIEQLVEVVKKDRKKEKLTIWNKIKNRWLKEDKPKEGKSNYNYSFYGETDKGMIREENEDNFFINNNLNYCIVADGMGGEAGGKEASDFFIKKVSKIFDKSEFPKEDINLIIKNAFESANQEIRTFVESNPDYKGMGCTAELLLCYKDEIVIGHVGDSRVYCYRNGLLDQLTKDHSVVQEKIDDGSITKKEAIEHPDKNRITRAVGVDETIKQDIFQYKIQRNDLLLVCSDGLTDMVDDDSIKKTLSQNISLEKKVEELINSANSTGGEDNITIVLVLVE